MASSPLTLIEVSGDHRRIGEALGEASAHAIRHVVPEIGRYRELQREWAGSDHLGALMTLSRREYPGYVEEIEGMARAAGVRFEDLFLWNCRGDMPGGGDQTVAAGIGCTSVMVPGTSGGERIIAHNEDDQPELDGHCHIVDVTPTDAPGFVSFYSPGLLPGHTFAVNRRGIVQTINHVRPMDQRIGRPRHFVCRSILDRERLGDVVQTLRAEDRASGFHHNLGQPGAGPLLSVEAPASGCVVTPVDAPRAHANHLLADAFASLPQVRAPSSLSRQSRADELIAGGALDGSDPDVVLADVGADLPIYRRERDAGDPGFTLASALFRIDDSRVGYEIFHDLRHPATHEGTINVA